MVLTDEIYSRLIFEGEHHSIMSLDGMKERCILLDGFSKTYAMTGWRMGYGVMRADLATHIARLMTNSNSCTASFTQVAGIEALRGPQGSVEKMCAEFKKRRDIMVTGLNKIKGFSCRLPKGAFYVFPNIKETGWPSKKLADALLDEAGVAALIGDFFRQVWGRLCAVQCGQFDRKHREGARSDRRLGNEESLKQGAVGKFQERGQTGRKRFRESRVVTEGAQEPEVTNDNHEVEAGFVYSKKFLRFCPPQDGLPVASFL